MTISKNILPGSGGAKAYEINQSLNFVWGDDSALVRTPTVTGDAKTWTISMWVKHHPNIGIDGESDGIIWQTGDGTGYYHTELRFTTTGTLDFTSYHYNLGATFRFITNRTFLDPSAWYHIVVTLDTTQAVTANRMKLWVNGIQETSFSTRTDPAQNRLSWTNLANGYQMILGNGYLGIGGVPNYQTSVGFAEVNFIDGTAKAASDFGEYSSGTGQWVPKEYEGSYGTNGFYQKYERGAAADTPFLFEGDFTIEMFFKLTSMQVTGGYSYPVLLWLPPHTGRHPNGNVGYKLQVNNANAGYNMYIQSSSPDNFTVEGGSGAGAIALNTWYHMAITREGMGSNNISMYVNGTRRGQSSYTGLVGSTGDTARIGASGRNYGNWAGYINNVRIVKGTAVYSGATYTVPTSDLTAISGTSLLALNSSGITDRLPATAPTLTAYGGSDVPVIQSSISGTVGTYTGLFSSANHNNANGGGITFKVPSAMGKDSSGNNNDFGAQSVFEFDSVKDSPTNNFCTVNTANNQISSTGYGGGNTISQGNLAVSGQSDNNGVTGTMSLPRSGKWYWEVRLNAAANGQRAMMFGVAPTTDEMGGSLANMVALGSHVGYLYGPDIANWGPTYGGLDIMGIAVDMDNGAIYFSKNNTWANSGNPTSGASKTGAAATTLLSSGHTWVPVMKLHWRDVAGDFNINFGQTSSFNASSGAGAVAPDANGVGEFWYAPPSGYLALCSKNLPEPSDVALAPKEHFNTVLYTGNNASGRQVTGVGFQPDFVWLKNRSVTNYHTLFDSVRGVTNYSFSNTTNGQQSNSSSVTAFTSDGITVNHNASFGNNNATSSSYVTWNWKAGGAAPVKTYAVKVVSDSGNKYRFDDFAASAQTVDLQEGGTYTFDQSDSSNSGHPFRLSTTSNGTHASGSEYTTGVVTTGSPGSAGAKTVITVAASAPTLYYYCSVHSGMGGQVNTNSLFGSTNFDGNRTSIVSANQAAGFSVSTHGHNLATANTFGHGLGVAPEVILEKKLNVEGGDGILQTTVIDGSPDYLRLNTNAAKADGWSGMNLPTSTVYNSSVGSGGGATSVVTYAFVSKPGYSQFGVYKGNGNVNGPFVYTDFRVGWIMIKDALGSGNQWIILDSRRDLHNEMGKYLIPNLDSIEEEYDRIDFLSNGFKIRHNYGADNTNGRTYFYMAYAEAPFKYANAR